jgi:predicted dehydrogenase
MAVRTAIVGTGGIARAHGEAARQNADLVDLVAAVDVDPQRLDQFRETYGVRRGYADLAEMLAQEQPELVQICTPPGLHVEQSIACLEAGAWVLCEKPLAGSLADLDRLEAAEHRTGRYVSSVFQWRFGSGAQHLRNLIQSQAMGRVLVGVCNTLWYRDAAYHAVGWRGRWSSELGGVNFGQAIHIMDLLLYLLGDWSSVQGVMDTVERQIEVENVYMGVVRFESGAIVSLTNSLVSPRQESYLRLDFPRTTVELTTLYGYRNQHWRFSPAPDAGPAEQQAVAAWGSLPTEVPSTQATQLRLLVEELQAGRRPQRAGLPEVRKTIEFLLSLYRAACTGQPVERGSITPEDPYYRGMTHALTVQTKEHA